MLRLNSLYSHFSVRYRDFHRECTCSAGYRTLNLVVINEKLVMNTFKVAGVQTDIKFADPEANLA
ncbi:MAG: hypothetical protein AAF456_22805, partial [Planctomycetota bacterium]